MKKTGIVFFGVMLLVSFNLSAQALEITSANWAYNIDGGIYSSFEGNSMPATGTLINGFGALTWTTNMAGQHSFIAFFDYELDEQINGFTNETGSTSGSPAYGQSWEIDEPGYTVGNLYYHVLSGSLDNYNALAGMQEDVSTALGWNFPLSEGQTALITLLISDQVPALGFYLRQFDPDSNISIYISSTMEIIAVPIPEPCSSILLGVGLLALAGIRRSSPSRRSGTPNDYKSLGVEGDRTPDRLGPA